MAKDKRTEWEFKTNEHSLHEIIEYFVKGYKLDKSEEIYTYEWFVDVTHNKVFIKVHLKPKN